MVKIEVHNSEQNIENFDRSIISFQSVGLSFGKIEILKNIDLDIRQGEFICVVGPSGCGKTTLLRILSGLQNISSGNLLYKDKKHNKPANDIAIVFQDYTNALLPWRTASGNISLAYEALKIPTKKRGKLAKELLNLVGLKGNENKYPSEMSGGMQQRLQIARCLAQEPSVLLMDEPFGALDAMTRQKLQDELLGIVTSTKMTTFFVTHDLEEAIYLADRVIALAPNPGHIAEIFDIELARPRNQMSTREDPKFLESEGNYLILFKGMKHE